MSFLCGYNFRICLRAGLRLINAVECRRLASRNSPTLFSFKKSDELRNERLLKRTCALLEGNQRKKKNLNSAANIMKSLEADPAEQLKAKLNNKIVTRLPKCTSPRMKQLSFIFGEHISNLFQSREVCSELTELGFEVTNVTVAPKLAYIVVSWNLTDEDNLQQVMELLPKSSSSIKNALSSSRVIANVPPVMFYRDTTQTQLMEVQRLLSIADMGPEEVLTAKDRNEAEADCEEDEITPESSNVYGINYEKFKEELMISKKRITNKILVESAINKEMMEIHVEKV